MSRSRTAEYVAFYRALETNEHRRPPLFRDLYAARFLSPRLRTVLSLYALPFAPAILLPIAEMLGPGARTSAIGRTAYIDEAVRDAVRLGTEQLVILGAGFDCRAHRMPELGHVRVFEVDKPDTQAYKRERLDGETPAARDDVVYVAVNFATDDLTGRLVASGWSQEKPTLFIWEGVTNYLTEAAVARVFEQVGACASGSAIVFTYIHRGAVEDTAEFPDAKKLRDRVRKVGEPWLYGIDPAELGALVGKYGLRLRDDLGADAYRRRYAALGAEDLRGYAFYRIAVAARVQADGMLSTSVPSS